MLYVRKLFTQDLRDGKQIAFPKEPSLSFFSFDYINKEEDRRINFTFKAAFNESEEHDGKVISTRLYAAGSEARMDGEVKAFIRDELNAKIEDLLIFKNKGTKHTDYEVMFLPQNNPFYPMFLALTNGDNHSVCIVEDEDLNVDNDFLPLQQIYYGAPGTGKSHTINEKTEGESVIRTTFHPDSDYSTFVGAYKPTMGLLPICDELGQPMKTGSTVLHKEQIIYEFVDQAFLQAYVQAWKFYAENSDTAKKQYLIIEEINRGNCAQIFGDLFQLLDRNDCGFSVYPINADKDMKKQLAKAFKKDGVTITIPNADKINALYKGKDIVSKVLSGDILVLPNNLYIWATMNTSDQSLFPIDSAFKRRWEWQYMPIGKGYDENGQEIKWAIEGATKKFSWWSFLEKINAQIGEATQSEDKKLGFFFCKATDGVISAEKFVGKVIFYLWNDVFKNNGFEGPIFKDVDGTELSFAKFYKSDMKGNAIVQKDKVELFLSNLGVEEFKDGNMPSEEPEEDEDGNQASSPSTGRDYTKFSINGVGNYAKNNLAAECVKKYIELNPTKTAEEVLNDWRSLGNIVPHFIESKEQYDARTDNSKRSHEIACGGAVIYVAHNGYGNNGKVLVLMDAVNQKDWGITIQKNV